MSTGVFQLQALRADSSDDGTQVKSLIATHAPASSRTCTVAAPRRLAPGTSSFCHDVDTMPCSWYTRTLADEEARRSLDGVSTAPVSRSTVRVDGMAAGRRARSDVATSCDGVSVSSHGSHDGCTSPPDRSPDGRAGSVRPCDMRYAAHASQYARDVKVADTARAIDSAKVATDASVTSSAVASFGRACSRLHRSHTRAVRSRIDVTGVLDEAFGGTLPRRKRALRPSHHESIHPSCRTSTRKSRLSRRGSVSRSIVSPKVPSVPSCSCKASNSGTADSTRRKRADEHTADPLAATRSSARKRSSHRRQSSSMHT
mmetsp:Transcript_73/g.211  ORF Transcript_73/g.211 Transcript_73/m.211 type:complete len:315 (-) Transcript_73:2404-3348(-)